MFKMYYPTLYEKDSKIFRQMSDSTYSRIPSHNSRKYFCPPTESSRMKRDTSIRSRNLKSVLWPAPWSSSDIYYCISFMICTLYQYTCSWYFRAKKRYFCENYQELKEWDTICYPWWESIQLDQNIWAFRLWQLLGRPWISGKCGSWKVWNNRFEYEER